MCYRAKFSFIRCNANLSMVLHEMLINILFAMMHFCYISTAILDTFMSHVFTWLPLYFPTPSHKLHIPTAACNCMVCPFYSPLMLKTDDFRKVIRLVLGVCMQVTDRWDLGFSPLQSLSRMEHKYKTTSSQQSFTQNSRRGVTCATRATTRKTTSLECKMSRMSSPGMTV